MVSESQEFGAKPRGVDDTGVEPRGFTAGSAAPRRLLLLDAMRGVAALAVVFYHLQGAFDRYPQPWMPDALASVFAHGYLGVNIFFALSGFVIAMSVKREASNLSYAGRFTIRRSVRLDPPLWTAIALEIALIGLGLHFMGELATAPLPSFPQVMSNMVYLQEFLGFEHINPIFWTLCYEIQFYLTFVFVLVLGAILGRATVKSVEFVFVVTIFATLFSLSLALHVDTTLAVPRGLGIHRWNEFFFGALTYWFCAKMIPRWVFAMAAVMVFAAAVLSDKPLGLIFVLVTCALCGLSFLRPSLDSLVNTKGLQALGLMSYSLYLYHGSLGYRTVTLGQHLLGNSLNAVTGPLLWVVALSVAIAGSAALWYLVERPTIALSRRVSLRQGKRNSSNLAPPDAEPAVGVS